MKTVLIAGGSGMIGTALTKALVERDYRVVVLSRHAAAHTNGVAYAQWNPAKGIFPIEELQTADHIVNLAGANLADKRWTEERKKLIVESRVQSGATIVKALKENPNHVQSVISSSAIGWYGEDPAVPNPHPFTEDAPVADNFLANTCRQWEEAIRPVESLGKRLVILRTGIALSRDGGAYEEFRWPLKFGVSPVLAGGRQVYSWIHIQDLVDLYIFALENPNLHGVFNAVSPQPVSNKTLMKTLLDVSEKKRLSVPVPGIFIKMAFGELSVEVLKSTTVSCEKIQQQGFEFTYPDITSAIRQLEHR